MTAKTQAIMPVHLMGKPADMDPIMGMAKRHKLMVIEDAAEAHGALYKGRKIGTLGDMAAFSLYAAHIVTSVEGGMITTNDSKIAEALRSLRNHGIIGKFEFHRICFSAKMNELEAAIGIGNIKIFDQILGQRRKNLLRLIEHFKKWDEFFISIKEDAQEKIGPHAFSIILKPGVNFTKDEIVDYLDEAGIDSRNLFYSIPTQCPSYRSLGYELGDFPEAEYCGDHGFHVGIHQDLNEGHMDYVAEVMEGFLKKKGMI
jgi:dTDP-4-amino-4,6-dideoxygalactose transaminase